MKSYYYFIHCQGDDLNNKIIHSVPFGRSSSEIGLVNKLSLLALRNSDIYFKIRSAESSEFVAKIMSNYQCTFKKSSPYEIMRLMKDCYPHNV